MGWEQSFLFFEFSSQMSHTLMLCNVTNQVSMNPHHPFHKTNSIIFVLVPFAQGLTVVRACRGVFHVSPGCSNKKSFKAFRKPLKHYHLQGWSWYGFQKSETIFRRSYLLVKHKITTISTSIWIFHGSAKIQIFIYARCPKFQKNPI